MLLIQRLTSILVCFLLLILRGMSADMEGCQKALQEFFRATSSSLASFKNVGFNGPLLDYYFIINGSLVDSLRYYYFNPVTKPGLYTNVIVTNPVRFYSEPDFQRITFDIQYPHNNGRSDGSITFYCKESDCSDSLSRLKEQMYKPQKLICLKQRRNDDEDHFIKLMEGNKIKATIFGQSFDMFDAELILQRLIRVPGTKRISSFAATRILLNEFDKTVIFGDVLGKVVAEVPLPQPNSPEVLEYIEGAIHMVNRELRRKEYFDEERSDRLKAIKPRGY